MLVLSISTPVVSLDIARDYGVIASARDCGAIACIELSKCSCSCLRPLNTPDAVKHNATQLPFPPLIRDCG